MPGTMGMVDAHGVAFVAEVEVGVGIVEVLGDRCIGAGIDLALEVGEIGLCALRLGVKLGVSGYFDVEIVAGFRADESHQLVGVAELAHVLRAGGQIAAQRDDVPDAMAFVFVEDGADVFPRRADAGQMRRGLVAFLLDFDHGFQRAVARGAAGAESYREELRVELGELLARGAQLVHALGRFGRKEFETQDG